MDNKRTVILLCLSIVIVIIATASVTYAYLSVGDVQKDANVLSSACFDVSFTENNLINLTSYPMSKDKGLSLTPYTITVTNKCEATNYKVLLNVLNETDSDLLSFINYSTDGKSFDKLNKLNTFKVPSELIQGTNNVKTTYILFDSQSIGATGSADATKSHTLRLWIDDSADNGIMGKVFKAQVSVYSGDVSLS